MKILVACEESQVVCMAFREKGHEAYSCDLQDCSGGHPEWHIQGDVLKVLNPSKFVDPFTLKYGIRFFTLDNVAHFVEKWDLIIAHPPCTYLSKAGARWMYANGEVDQERLLKAMAAKRFFMQIWNADCDCIVIENPTPLKIVGLPKESQVIQPYQFGCPYSKRTLLWLKGLPILTPTKILNDYSPYCPSNTSRFSKGFGGSCGFAFNAKQRSKTFLGIAAAMADQWG